MYTQSELTEMLRSAVEHLQYPDEAPRLYEPVRYTLDAGGKRLRPTLVLMAANLFTDAVQPAVQPAVGLELYHNFTLLHDDVMDKAPDRRGRPTVHVKWNDNAAILSGDAMQGLAYTLVGATPVAVLKPVLDLFNRTNLEICAGQQLDMEFERRSDVSADEYIRMIRLKTSVLLGCALKMGALIGRQTALERGETATAGCPEDVELLYRIGENLGLAFQLQDDWLDCWGDAKTFGKRIGGDIVQNKKTYLLIRTLELADGRDLDTLLAELSPATARMGESEKIAFFTDVYQRCGAEAACRKAIEYYQRTALDALDRLSIDHRRTTALSTLAQSLTHRKV